MSNNTFPSAIVWFTAVVLVAGIMLGLGLGGFDPSNVAHAEQAGSDRYLDQARRIEMEYLRQQREAELETLRAKYQQELALAEERSRREMELAERRAQVVNSMLPIIAAVGLLAGLIASGGLAYYLVCTGRSLALAAQAPAASQVNWRNESQRAQAVRLAREAERLWRGDSSRLTGSN